MEVHFSQTVPALQQLGIYRLLSAQGSLFARIGQLAFEGDAFPQRRVAEGVSAPAELHPRFQVVVGEGGGRTWRGLTRGLFILLRGSEEENN